MTLNRAIHRTFQAVSAAIMVFVLPIVAHAQLPIFTKSVVKVNGVPVGSQPASVTTGDDLSWVITYQYGPGSLTPAQTNLKDTLSVALQYDAGSLAAPPSWTRQWFDGLAWVASEPLSVGGVGAFTAFPQGTPFGTGQTALFPAPPSGPLTTTGSGDGYEAIPFNGNVYLINHHTTGTYLDCVVVSTGAHCAGYPAHVPVAAGMSYVGNTNNDNITPGKPVEYLDRIHGKLYFPVEKINTTLPHELGILCADLINQQSCGFVKLDTLGVVDNTAIEGIGGIGTKVYMQLPQGRIGCLDLSTNLPCLGEPYQIAANSNGVGWQSGSMVVGTRIYTTWRGSPSPFVLTCAETSPTPAPCVGWGIKMPDPTGTVGILYPRLNGSGTVDGVCVHTTAPVNSAPTGFTCYNPSTGASVGYPASYLSWVNSFGGGSIQGLGFGQTGSLGTRVFNGSSAPLGTVGCFDFSPPGSCGGYPISGPAAYYTTVADTERPGCMWYYGDDRKLGSFQASDGKACSGRTAIDFIVTPDASYCAGGTITGWDKLSVTGLTLGGGVTATLTIYDGNNPTTLALTGGLVPYAQNLPVTSLPLLLGAGGLGIGYGNAAGQYKSLRVVLQFSGITSSAPWSMTPPPNAEVTWIGSPPQFCFRTKVVGCDDKAVTNQATAMTTPVSGPVLNNTAPNPPFSAAHLPGPGCTSMLTIKKLFPSVPLGFGGTFKFNVTCSTPSGLLQQQLSVVWPGPTVILPDIPLGSTCTVSEDFPLPPLPSGFSWVGVPVINPTGGVIHITSGTNQVSFTNEARGCNDRGQVKITKKLGNVPPGFTGTFTFNLVCWSGTTLTTQQAQITLPGPSTVVVPGIATGSSCTVTETGPLPPLPSGWFWLGALYFPPSGQVIVAGNCCPEVIVENEAKFCCADSSGTLPHDVDIKP